MAKETSKFFETLFLLVVIIIIAIKCEEIVYNAITSQGLSGFITSLLLTAFGGYFIFGILPKIFDKIT